MKNDIVLVMPTINRDGGKTLSATLRNFERAGVFRSDRFNSFHVTNTDDDAKWIESCVPPNCPTHVYSTKGDGDRVLVASKNVAKALNCGAAFAGCWVLFVEDDIDVCNDFLGSVGRWLDQFAVDGPMVYSFSVPHSAMPVNQGHVWREYPVGFFCCTQAFAIRSRDASSLAAYLNEHPSFTGPDGHSSTGAYDLTMRDWMCEQGLTNCFASVPSFVQHVGTDSALTPGKPIATMPTWPGRTWSYSGKDDVFMPARKPVLLWVGDACVASGFAKATHETLNVLRETWDVVVLGLNFNGGPHPYPYPIHTTFGYGGDYDGFGILRMAELVTELRPDVVVIQNDPWNIPRYIQAAGNVPVVAIVAVDGKNCRGLGLNQNALTIFWTEFGEREARIGGYVGKSAVVPLGVDLDIFAPGDKTQARRDIGLPKRMVEGFIVGNLNRNQPRKRLDLTVSYFAEWTQTRQITDAYLYLHVAPTGDAGYDLDQLNKYYGIAGKVILSEPPIGHGVPEQAVVRTMQALDVLMTTTQGEGFGLPTFEAMACRIATICPDWSALGELCAGASALVPCSEISTTPNNINVIGATPDRQSLLRELDRMYYEPAYRADIAAAGFARANEDRFRWRNIGLAVDAAIRGALYPPKVNL